MATGHRGTETQRSSFSPCLCVSVARGKDCIESSYAGRPDPRHQRDRSATVGAARPLLSDARLRLRRGRRRAGDDRPGVAARGPLRRALIGADVAVSHRHQRLPRRAVVTIEARATRGRRPSQDHQRSARDAAAHALAGARARCAGAPRRCQSARVGSLAPEHPAWPSLPPSSTCRRVSGRCCC